MENTNYKQQYNKALDMYKEIMEDYEVAVASSRYHEILATMPFEFLNAIQLCEKLSLYEKLEEKPRMHFSSLEEAKVFYRNLVGFHKKIDRILEDAAYITEIGRIADNINELATSSPYLGAAFCMVPNEEIICLAKKCLSEIPKYPQLLTKKFRWNYIESAIIALNKEDLEQLVQMKVIKPNDIDNISLTEKTNDYHDKIEFLCQKLHHPQPILASYELKLKGVTFPNEDGSSRQENLMNLKAFIDENPDKEVLLTAEAYMYNPQLGEAEPAIKVAWDGKVIGNVGKTAVSEILEKFKNPQFVVKLKKLSGGEDGLSFGCTINLQVIAPGYANLAISEEQEMQALSQTTQQDR